jgi:hypothetical protein
MLAEWQQLHRRFCGSWMGGVEAEVVVTGLM